MNKGNSTRRLVGASAIMASGTLISRALGLVRVMMIAFILGNGTRQADMLALATMVPNSLYILFAGGALNTVLVPQIVRAIKNDEDGGEAYTNRIMTAFMLIVTAVAVIITIGAPVVTAIYTSNDWRDPALADQYASMVALTYLTLPQIFFYGAFFLLGQILNARDKFGPMMWAPIANNIVTIIVLGLYFVVWGNGEDHGSAFTTGQILLLGLGTTFGIAVQTIVMIPFVRRVGFKLRPRFDLKGTGLGHTFALTKWTVGFVAVNQLALMVVNRLATSATAGGSGAGVTVYSNAHLLWILPHSLITVSLATAMLPSASRLAAAGDLEGVAGEFTRTVRLAFLAIVPATAAFLALSGPMTALMFGQGTGAQDAIWISWALRAFALGLIPFTLQFVCLRTFYALENTRTPFFLQMVIAGTNIVAAIGFVWLASSDAWVATALALAYSLAYTVGVGVTWSTLRRRLPALDGREVILHVVRLTLGAAVGGVAAFFAARWLMDAIPSGTLGELTALVAGGVLILGAFVLIGKGLHVRELASLTDLVRSRFGRRRAAAAPEDAVVAVPRSAEDDDAPRTDILPTVNSDMLDVFDDGPSTVVRNRPAASTHSFPTPTEPDAPASAPSPAVPPVADPAGPPHAAAGIGDEPTGPLDIPGLYRDEALGGIAAGGALLNTRYELHERLAQANGTETWRAHDQVLSRDVAVHVLAPEDPRITELMVAARKGAVATDSRFLRVLDAAEVIDPELGIGAYVVREFAPGRSLTELLSAGPLSTLEAAYIVRELADALAAVHAQGLFHEQINPDNVIVTSSGAVRLGGFGIDAALAPRAEGGSAWSVREHSDVVALGALLYASLVRRWPGRAAFGMPAAPIVAGETAPAHLVQAGVSPALDRICTVTLTDRGAAGEARIKSAGQLAETLDGVLGTADASPDLEERVRALGDRGTDAPFRRPGVGIWTPVSENPDTAALARATAADRTRTMPGPIIPPPADGPGASPPSPAAAGHVPGLYRDHGAGEPPSDTGTDEERRGVRGIVALLVLALFIAVTVFIATLAGDDAQQAGQSPSGSASAEPSGSASADGSQSASGSPSASGPISIVGVDDFDPERDNGNGEENPDRAANAIDGDPSTTWITMRYLNRPDMGGEKPGVGLVLDLGERRTVSSATVSLVGDGPTAVELRVPAGAEMSMAAEADWEIVASDAEATGDATITLDEPVETQYLLVYVTSLPEVEGGYRGEIAEITVQ